MRAYTLLMLIFVSISCSKSGSSGEKDVTPENLTGSWELKTLTSTDSSMPTTFTPDAIQKNGGSKFQLRIDGENFELIISDDLSVSADLKMPYKVSNRKIVIDGSKGVSIPGYSVVSLSANDLVLQPDDPKSKDMLWHFSRIGESQLATKTLTPLSQNLDVQFKTEKLDLSESFSDNYNGGGEKGIYCSYLPDKQNLRINFWTIKKTGDGISMSSLDPSGSYVLPGTFDFSKSESQDISFEPYTQSLNANASFSNNNASIQVLAQKVTRCDFKVAHNLRVIDFEGGCQNSTANNKDSGTVHLKGHCIATLR